MKGILISNIGNRNLKLNGEFLTKTFSDKQSPVNETFRSITKSILDKISEDGNSNGLEAVIIDEVLRSCHKDISKVIFVSSDMPDGERNDQDTIYEGEILCKLLGSEYPEIQFENRSFRALVYDHDQLFRTYRGFLDRLKKEISKNILIYCDAGGTSQQKLAMRILLEYLLPSGQLRIIYVAQNDKGKSTLLTGESYEYRKIIDMEHVFRSISSSSYSDAINLMLSLGFKDYSFQVRLVRFLESRYRLLHKEAKINAQWITESKYDYPLFIENYYEGNEIGDFEQCNNAINEDSFFRLCEILSLFKRKLNQGIIEQAIHFFFMFCENYLHSVIEEQLKYNLTRSYESESARLLSDIEGGFLKIKKSNLKIVRAGIPLLILVAESIENDFNQRVVRIIKNCNSNLSDYKKSEKQFFGLDYYRNKFAHKGQAILLKDFERQPYFKEIQNVFEIFGMPDGCIYEKMNDEVIDFLKV